MLTRCPNCLTLFRVTESQLLARSGRVRCGRCQHAFDAVQSLVETRQAGGAIGAPDKIEAPARERDAAPLGESPRAVPPEVPAQAAPDQRDRIEAGSPPAWEPATTPEQTTNAISREAADARVEADARAESDATVPGADVPLAGALAVAVPAAAAAIGATEHGEEPHDAADVRTEAREAAEPARADAGRDAGQTGPVRAAERLPDAATSVAGPAREAGSGAAAAPPPPAYARPAALRLPRRRTWLWAPLIVLLALALAAQATYQLRNDIPAWLPAARPALEAACEQLGCRIEPPRARDRLDIEASDLQADPAHKGLLTLTATLRNRAEFDVAYPHLELTLIDLKGSPVVRRALAPAEYAGGTADIGQGIPANGEVAVKVFIDASATRQQGYSVDLFYP